MDICVQGVGRIAVRSEAGKHDGTIGLKDATWGQIAALVERAIAARGDIGSRSREECLVRKNQCVLRKNLTVAVTVPKPGAEARREIDAVRVEPALHSYVVSLVRRTRDWPAISLGASPRAAIGLFLVARAMAGMDGRDYLLPDDVKAAALPVLRHRILLKPEADLEGLTTDQVISRVINAVEVPK